MKTKIETFIAEVLEDLANVGLDNVYNTDQSGFNLEIHSGRTLSIKGLKDIDASIQSMNSMTRSYTIQITVSATGILQSPMLIVLKELHGFFGKRVQKNLFRPKNVFIMASKSGKLTKDHVRNWTREVFTADISNKSILILDAWRGQCHDTIITALPPNKTVKLHTIPEGATKYIQPLDVFTFRQWKDFARKFSDSVIVNNINIKLHDRNNIIKLQSLIHNQFSATRYKDMLRYAWYKSGYINANLEEFSTPADDSFKDTHKLTCDICGEIAFITCGWCNKSLCFKHFFHDYHFHDHV